MGRSRVEVPPPSADRSSGYLGLPVVYPLSGMSAESSADAVPNWRRSLGSYVNHDDPLVRFVALWVVCAVLFVAAWYVGYYLLPEGLLRGKSAASALPEYAESVWAEFLTIFGWNLAVALLVVAANTFRSVRTPLGYLVVAVNWVQGGLVWGTGSLLVGTGRFAPSLSVAFGRSGLYELTAYVAVAVATRGVMVWHQRSPRVGARSSSASARRGTGPSRGGRRPSCSAGSPCSQLPTTARR